RDDDEDAVNHGIGEPPSGSGKGQANNKSGNLALPRSERAQQSLALTNVWHKSCLGIILQSVGLPPAHTHTHTHYVAISACWKSNKYKQWLATPCLPPALHVARKIISADFRGKLRLFILFVVFWLISIFNTESEAKGHGKVNKQGQITNHSERQPPQNYLKLPPTHTYTQSTTFTIYI
ncbi:Hypothetical predicted protein, partial [Drosophila guanche]